MWNLEDLGLTSWYDLSRWISVHAGVMMGVEAVFFFEAAVSLLLPPEAGEVFD